MKKYIITLLLLLWLLPCPLTPVLAAGETYIFDDADLLTDQQEQQLEETAAAISETYGCGVYVVTVWDYRQWDSNVRSASEQFFLDAELGLGAEGNGVLLMLSMAERDYALIAHGTVGNRAFTDFGKDVLSEQFLDDFRYDDWYAGFADYLSYCGDFLREDAAGRPVDRTPMPEAEESSGSAEWLFVAVPAAVAAISCGIMAATMKTARARTSADEYILRKSIRITGRYDRFLTRTVVRQKIETESSGGTSVNSGGFSGKSGKF